MSKNNKNLKQLTELFRDGNIFNTAMKAIYIHWLKCLHRKVLYQSSIKSYRPFESY